MLLSVRYQNKIISFGKHTSRNILFLFLIKLIIVFFKTFNESEPFPPPALTPSTMFQTTTLYTPSQFSV